MPKKKRTVTSSDGNVDTEDEVFMPVSKRTRAFHSRNRIIPDDNHDYEPQPAV